MVKKLFNSHPYEIAIFVTTLALLGFLLLLAYAGFFRMMISGETLYDISYPALNSASESISKFFQDRVQGRFLHGVLITALYKSLGFNPPLYYFTSIALICFAGAAIALTLKPYLKNHVWIASVLAVIASLLPTQALMLVNLKNLHHSLAWGLFWWACYCMQKWVTSEQGNRKLWLLSASLLFIAAWLSYEAIAFLLPVGVFLASLSAKRRFLQSFLAALTITMLALVASRGFALLFGIVHTREVLIAPGEVILSPLRGIVTIVEYALLSNWDNLFAFWPPTLVIAKALFLGLMSFGTIVVVQFGVDNLRGRTSEPAVFWLSLAGLWLAFFTHIPFSLVGQLPTAKSLVGVGYGACFLLVAVILTLYSRRQRGLANLVLAFTAIFLIASGFLSYRYQVTQFDVADTKFVNFVRSLRTLVPDVQEDTTFVLVNTNWGRTGCIGYMNMLYPGEDVWCIHLLDNDTEETYTHTLQGQLIEDTGKVFEPDFVILEADENGFAHILDSVNKEIFPLVPVNWFLQSAVSTNHGRILQEAQPGKNLFYDYVQSLP